MSKFFLRLLSALFVLNLLFCTVLAADPKIVEAEVGSDTATVYIKGVGQADSAAATLGREAVEVVLAKPLADTDIPIKTLILIDNSLSIPSTGRSSIRQQLAELIAARKEGETYAIGTISEQVSILQDFTDDYLLLKRTLDNLPHHDQVTYITDALYDYLIQQPFAKHNGSFVRILLASDGVDNKSIGYTKDELLGLLKQQPVPIYTIGIPNGKKGNNEEIENMFSIARAAGGSAALLSDLGSGTSLSAMMNVDQSNVACKVRLPEELRDGSLQTLTITLRSGESARQVSFDQLRMPLSERVPEPEPEPEPEPVPEPEPEPEPMPEPPPPEPEPQIAPLVIAAIAGVLLIAVLVAVLLLWRKRRAFRTISAEDEVNRRIDQRMETEGTVCLDDDDRDGGTVHVWDGDALRRVTLTDTRDAARCFQKPIMQSLMIGLSRECDICVNYDKSVSRRHCEILREGDQFYVVNLSQSNGTMINGNKIMQKTRISNGDVLKLGRVELRVELNR